MGTFGKRYRRRTGEMENDALTDPVVDRVAGLLRGLVDRTDPVGDEIGGVRRALRGARSPADAARLADSSAPLVGAIVDAGRGHLAPDLREVLAIAGITHPEIDLWTAQALIDAGRPYLGLALLASPRPGDARPLAEPVPERAAYLAGVSRGLIARAWKDVALARGPVVGADAARRALDAYAELCCPVTGTTHDDARRNRRWGLANRFGLLWWLGRGDTGECRALARECLDVVRVDRPEPWDHAARCEAHLALDERDPAHEAMAAYLASGAGVRKLRGTLRQMEELWTSDPSDRGGLATGLRDVLRFAILAEPGGSLEAGAGTIARLAAQGVPEGLYGGRTLGRGTLSTLLSKARGVCRIIGKVSERAVATGFLVRGDELHPDWGATPMVVTCSHAVADQAYEYAGGVSSRARDVIARFSAIPGSPGYDLVQVWASPPGAFDATVLALRGPDPGHVAGEALGLDLDLCRSLGTRTDAVVGRSVFVLGHPGGSHDVRFSVSNNDLLSYRSLEARGRGMLAFQYRTPTEEGSSGSPVFDSEAIGVIGLHHLGTARATDGSLANQAVCMASLIGEIAGSGLAGRGPSPDS